MRLEKVLSKIIFGVIFAVIIILFATLIYLVVRPASPSEMIESQQTLYQEQIYKA